MSDPSWERIDLSQHEELAKKIITLSNVGTAEYYREKKFHPESYPTTEQLQHALEHVKGLGAEMFALKLAPELFGDRVMVTLRYKDEMCSRPLKLPLQPRGERADVAWVTADLKDIATGTWSFDPRAARPILYQRTLYMVQPTIEGLNVYVPNPLHQSPIFVITTITDSADKNGKTK